MKLNKVLFPTLACTLMLSACDENKMDWGMPADQDKVTIADIPLGIKEKLANYDKIKVYAAQYAPHMSVGLGVGADYYVDNEAVYQLANENYQMLTTGNAMKHQSVVKNNGELNFATIDKFLAAVPADMKIYGHNFLWHTQQNQNYLKSLIVPKMEIQSDSDIANVLQGDNSDFSTSLGGWGSWGSNKESQTLGEGLGKDGSNCMVLSNKGDGNFWEAQCAYTFADPLLKGKVYVLRFNAKSSSSAGLLQFQYQNGTTYGSQGGYSEFSVGTDWTTCEKEFTITDFDDVNRILINFGKVSGTYYIDDIEFGLKQEDPMENIVTNTSFEDGTTTGYTGLWGKYTYKVEAPGQDGDLSIHFTMTDETAVNYDSQLFYTTGILEVGTTYAYSFYVKSDCNLAVQFMGQNASYGGFYGETYNAPTEWLKCEGEFTYQESHAADVERVGIQFGGTPGANLWVDNFKFGKKKAEPAMKRAATRASTVTYILKTPEEKKALLLTAMEEWIKGMAQHPGMERIMDWDVINEPIHDNGKWRGFDGAFMDTDTEPVETTTEGLTLNWSNETGNGHFYWGYYIGKDYAPKAFEFARKYCPEGAHLFVNDYNLETSPNKLASLIEFVEYIDQNNATGQPIVDGIGTQMHVQVSITREQVDAMFQTLAATGKLVRVTELDVALGTANPSAEQLEQQSEVYQMIFDSFRTNVPEAQQSGITIWGVSDHPDEHEYWLKDESPNIFDANYARKWAYKGVCDGIAGRDISEDFSGEDWKNAY